jgi:hypothetical protein
MTEAQIMAFIDKLSDQDAKELLTELLPAMVELDMLSVLDQSLTERQKAELVARWVEEGT